MCVCYSHVVCVDCLSWYLRVCECVLWDSISCVFLVDLVRTSGFYLRPLHGVVHFFVEGDEDGGGLETH